MTNKLKYHKNYTEFGDTVIVRQQNDAESDEIVIALVNRNDDVCKRLKKYENSIALVSINANYEPMYFNQEEILEKPVLSDRIFLTFHHRKHDSDNKKATWRS